jgi:ribosome-binding factor A
MKNLSILRQTTIIHRELGSFLNDIVGTHSFGYVNITEVVLSSDLSFATVYYTLLTEDKEQLNTCQNTLQNKKSLIRGELAKRVKDMRKIPDLIFKFDEAIAYGNKIESILASLKK